MANVIKNISMVTDNSIFPPTEYFSNVVETTILPRPTPKPVCCPKILQPKNCYSKNFCCKNYYNCKSNCKHNTFLIYLLFFI